MVKRLPFTLIPFLQGYNSRRVLTIDCVVSWLPHHFRYWLKFWLQKYQYRANEPIVWYTLTRAADCCVISLTIYQQTSTNSSKILPKVHIIWKRIRLSILGEPPCVAYVCNMDISVQSIKKKGNQWWINKIDLPCNNYNMWDYFYIRYIEHHIYINYHTYELNDKGRNIHSKLLSWDSKPH